RRVDVGTGIEEQFRNVDRVPGRLLTKALDAVARDVLQERRLMVARRPRAYERRVCTEQEPERRHVAGDDGLDRGFELRKGRGRARERVDVRGELRPALEPVHARDDILRVGKRTCVRSPAGRGHLLPGEVLNLTDASIEPRTMIAI